MVLCDILWCCMMANVERDSPSEHVCCEFPCRSIERRVQSVWYFFEGMNWIATQFPINSLISHLRKTPQSPLSIVLLIDLLPRLPSPHLVLTCLLSSPIPSSLFVCICANVCTISSVRPLGTTPVRLPHPLQKALFALRDLREPALLKASQDC